jgi:hypothetical protein
MILFGEIPDESEVIPLNPEEPDEGADDGSIMIEMKVCSKSEVDRAMKHGMKAD